MASVFVTLATAAALAPAGKPTVASLAARARALCDSWGAVAGASAFDSSYADGDGDRRGWANWLIRERLMLGQYPHCQPAPGGPSVAEAEQHLGAVLSAGVTAFTCLQAEVPPQDDGTQWPSSNGVGFADPELRARWPEPFVRYQPTADKLAKVRASPQPRSHPHCPHTFAHLTRRASLSQGARQAGAYVFPLPNRRPLDP